ncbi:restriction endonuclease subunit S [Flavobacterium sp. DSP2-3-1]|uniref:restriction endonuclease subunit S n=1 Tax=Flavobacterium sp. DSP2-3-1 TaxID=2804620 RepID=UPI003CF489F8
MEENNSIPDGWDNLELSKLTNFATGKKDVNQGSSIGEYPFFTCSKKVFSSEYYSFDKEALLIAGNGDVGTVHYYTGKFEAYQRTYILSDFSVNVQYLYQYLKSNLIKHLSEGQSGTTIQFIKISQLKNFKILKPVALKEQSKIAEILSKADNAILETEKIIAKYNRIKIGLMQNLLTKGIDDKGNIRSEETHEFKDSPLGKIPKEWDFSQIANVYDLKSGITPLRSNKKYFSREGHNWVKTLDLNEDYLFETEEKVSDYALNNTSLKLMPINSILIAMYGGWEQIGRTSILKKEAGTNQAITCLSNPKFEMNSDFVQFILQYYRFKWKQFAVSTRKDPNITKSDVENFLLTYPQDISEQNNIADKINLIKKNISYNEIELKKLKSIKTGLMQDLLSGKKRVQI